MFATLRKIKRYSCNDDVITTKVEWYCTLRTMCRGALSLLYGWAVDCNRACTGQTAVRPTRIAGWSD